MGKRGGQKFLLHSAPFFVGRCVEGNEEKSISLHFKNQTISAIYMSFESVCSLCLWDWALHPDFYINTSYRSVEIMYNELGGFAKYTFIQDQKHLGIKIFD